MSKSNKKRQRESLSSSDVINCWEGTKQKLSRLPAFILYSIHKCTSYVTRAFKRHQTCKLRKKKKRKSKRCGQRTAYLRCFFWYSLTLLLVFEKQRQEKEKEKR